MLRYTFQKESFLKNSMSQEISAGLISNCQTAKRLNEQLVATPPLEPNGETENGPVACLKCVMQQCNEAMVIVCFSSSFCF